MRNFLLTLVLFISSLIAPYSQGEQTTDPTVILVGIDGFRWDLLQRYELPNLQALADKGAQLDQMQPVMPTKTFANFYAMATGVYPNRSGVMGNNTYDRKLKRLFGMRDATSSELFQSEPIWITAEKNGIKAANMFWVGSEAEYQGLTASYWHKYDGRVSNSDRVKQIIDWLKLPKAQRPRLLTLYFSSLDSASHTYGVNSRQEAFAAKHVDKMIGKLTKELSQLTTVNNIHLLIVGDHGMADLSAERTIYIDDYLDKPLSQLDDIGSEKQWAFSPQLSRPNYGNAVFSFFYTDSAETTSHLQKQLIGKHPNWQVYLPNEVPDTYHLKHPTREPDLIVVPDTGWLISKRHVPFNKTYVASHGFDNRHPSMQAGFIATGPLINKNSKLKKMENTQLYCVTAEILGLPWQGKECKKEQIDQLIKSD